MIKQVTLQSFFDTPPSSEVFQNEHFENYIQSESNKIYALQITGSITAVALVVISAVGITFLCVTKSPLLVSPLFLPVGIPVAVGVVGLTAIAFYYGKKWVDFKVSENKNLVLLREQQSIPEIKNVQDIVNLVKSPDLLKQFDLSLQKDGKSPINEGLLSLIAQEMSEDLLERDTALNHIMRQVSFTSFSPEQKYFCVLRICREFYPHYRESIEKLAELSKSHTFDWIPSGESLENCDTLVNKEATKALMLRVFQVAATIAVIAIASIGVIAVQIYHPSSFMLSLGLTTLSIGRIVVYIWKELDTYCTKSETTLKTYKVYQSKQSLLPQSPSNSLFSLDTLNDVFQNAQNANAQSSEVLSSSISDSFYEGAASVYFTLEEGVLSLKAKINGTVSTEDAKSKEEQPSVSLSKDLLSQFSPKIQQDIQKTINSPDFKALSPKQQYYWAIQLSELLHRVAAEEASFRENLSIFAKQQNTIYFSILEKIKSTQVFFLAARRLEKLLRNPEHPINHETAEVSQYLAFLLEAVEKSAENEMQLDLSGVETFAKGLDDRNTPQDLLAAISSVNALLRQEMEKSEHHKHGYPFTHPQFVRQIHTIYTKLLSKALQDDSQLKARIIQQMADLIRTHAMLFAEVMKVRQAKAALDHNYDITRQGVYDNVKRQLYRRMELIRFLNATTIDPELSANPQIDPIFSPNRLHEHAAWDAIENRFIGEVAKLPSKQDQTSIASCVMPILHCGEYFQSKSKEHYRATSTEPQIRFQVKKKSGEHRDLAVPLIRFFDSKDKDFYEYDKRAYQLFNKSPIRKETV